MIFRWSPWWGCTPRSSACSHYTLCNALGAGSLTRSEAPPAPESAYTLGIFCACSSSGRRCGSHQFLCRHTMLYCACLWWFADTLFYELRSVNPTLSRPVGTSFQTFAHFVSFELPFGSSHNVSGFSSLLVRVLWDPWSLLLMTCWRLTWS